VLGSGVSLGAYPFQPGLLPASMRPWTFGRVLNVLALVALSSRVAILLYRSQVWIKDGEAQAGMRDAGRLGAEVLSFIDQHVKPGVTTGELDARCHRYINDVQHTTPAPLNYGGLLDLGAGISFPTPICSALHGACWFIGLSPFPLCGFPAATCVSVNDVVCHGVPSFDTFLRKGDIVNIDVTVINSAGYHGDTSRMWVVGETMTQDGTILRQKGRGSRPGQVSEGARLVADTHEALWRGIRAVRPGNTVGDIGNVIGTFARSKKLGIVDSFFGHGIGKAFHEGPMVAHDGLAASGEPLREGMIFTIEPMLNTGSKELRVLADQWSAVTVDGGLSAQWEHTILVTRTGFEVLTLRKEEEDAGYERIGPSDPL
jgi:methionyl aminopeptidase